MGRVAIVTDSNSGITQAQSKELGVFVIPMPFTIDGKEYFEDINLTQDNFYQNLGADVNIFTSQPAVGNVLDLWDSILGTYDEIVHIPMSSGLSSSCQTALTFADDYNGKVHVVNNQRISVTQKQSVFDAIALAESGKNASEIKSVLEQSKLDASIYIMVDTLKYLKRGGRVTPAAAALGTVLNLKPVLQIQGDKLDAFSKARGIRQAKSSMLQAMKEDMEKRFGGIHSDHPNVRLHIAHTANSDAALAFRQEVESAFPGHQVDIDHLSLSVACHIGPGSLALACTKVMDYSSAK